MGALELSLKTILFIKHVKDFQKIIGNINEESTKEIMGVYEEDIVYLIQVHACSFAESSMRRF